MLTYHPAFDLYNAMFRMLRLLRQLGDRSIEVERLRILDFYLLFPSLLRDIQMPISARKFRSRIGNEPNSYEVLPDPKRLFDRLDSYQMAAVQCLAAYSFVDPEELKQGRVKRTSRALPPELETRIEQRNESDFIVELLTGPLVDVDLYGKSGLKQRTDLFEHRYDPV